MAAMDDATKLERLSSSFTLSWCQRKALSLGLLRGLSLLSLLRHGVGREPHDVHDVDRDPVGAVHVLGRTADVPISPADGASASSIMMASFKIS